MLGQNFGKRIDSDILVQRAGIVLTASTVIALFSGLVASCTYETTAFDSILGECPDDREPFESRDGENLCIRVACSPEEFESLEEKFKNEGGSFCVPIEEIDAGPDAADDGGDLMDAGPDAAADDGGEMDAGPDADMGLNCDPNTPQDVTNLIRNSFIYRSASNPVLGSSSVPVVNQTNNPNSILQIGNSSDNCEITNVFYGPGDPNFTKDLTIMQHCVDANLGKALYLEEGRLSAGQARLHGGLWVFEDDGTTIRLDHYTMPTISNQTLNAGVLQESMVLDTNSGNLDYTTINSSGNTVLCQPNVNDLVLEMSTVLTTYKNDSGL